MSYFAPTYFGKNYFPGTYFPPLEDALTGVALLTGGVTSNAPLAWPWQDLEIPQDEPRPIDDEAIIIALLLAA